jgi:hypothetical protein
VEDVPHGVKAQLGELFPALGRSQEVGGVLGLQPGLWPGRWGLLLAVLKDTEGLLQDLLPRLGVLLPVALEQVQEFGKGAGQVAD